MAALELPRIDHLRKQLRLDADDGRIWLGEQRMALIHVQSLAALRRELIDSLGADKARGLLTRMGYTSGVQDADMARRTIADRSFQDAFLAGPRLHMLEGMVSVEFEKIELDVERGHFYAQVVWTQSIEVECHLLHYGASIEPVCWMELGYAAGYTTAFLGRPILYREVECRGAGGKACRIVGKPLDEWGDTLDDLRHFQSEAFVNRVMSRATEPAAPSKTTVEVADDEMVGLSPGFNAATHLVRKVAATKATVLFLGETGVGKELFARNLHRESDRASAPFVAVNCAAIPDNLLESELFGVEKGAFTGALASRPGRFERAGGGTLFLDEIGTLTLEAQGKLLRALQTGEIERVGDVRTRKVDVRLVAATNEDLKLRVRESTFRSDLYYRLNVFPIRIPPLRERRDDLPLLMRTFLAKFSRMHRKHVTGFTERAIRSLLDYDFPGNIRELENMIERAVILSSDGGPLDVFFLFADGGTPAEPAPHAVEADRDEVERAVTEAVGRRPLSLDALERTVMMTAVERAGGNLSSAARMIGLTRRQLAYRLKAAADAVASRA
jgi:two-component system, NtrC family, response regulator HydG